MPGFFEELQRELGGRVTGRFLDVLLAGMEASFALSPGYRKNIQDFRGRYVFRTADGLVATSCIFSGGMMTVQQGAIEEWDARVTFEDAEALRGFLFSRDQEILESVLENEVSVDGNLNYIYKFGFMVRDLQHRFDLFQNLSGSLSSGPLGTRRGQAGGGGFGPGAAGHSTGGGLDALTLLPQEPGDSVAASIAQDLLRGRTALGLLRGYMEELQGEPDSNAPAWAKLAWLFAHGVLPEELRGFHHGATLCMRAGARAGALARWGNTINFIWGNTLASVSPWAGKSFSPVTSAELATITGGAVQPAGEAYQGINGFHVVDDSILSRIAFHAMDLAVGLQNAPAAEVLREGYKKKGGNFVAYRAPAMDTSRSQQVLQLNYRYRALGCRVPLNLLVDELVQLAEGLYLGQLHFATDRVLENYDPALPDHLYRYEHFGYFTLFDQRWHEEARRLLPFAQIPRPPA